MRELKFRVWNGHSMEYNVTVGKFGNFYVNPENGNGLNPQDSASLTTCTTKYHENTPVMQFSGLKDEMGDDIYEGDIIENSTGRYVVNFRNGGFSIERPNGSLYAQLNANDVGGKYKIVGNIYKNLETNQKELIKTNDIESEGTSEETPGETILDKMVMAIYVNVGNLEEQEITKYVNKLSKELKLGKTFKDLVALFIPTRDNRKSNIEILYVPSK